MFTMDNSVILLFANTMFTMDDSVILLFIQDNSHVSSYYLEPLHVAVLFQACTLLRLPRGATRMSRGVSGSSKNSRN